MRWRIEIEAGDEDGRPFVFPARDEVEAESEAEALAAAGRTPAGLFARLSWSGARPLALRVRPASGDGAIGPRAAS